MTNIKINKVRSDFETSRLKLSALKRKNAAFIGKLLNTPGWIRFIGDRNVHNHDDAVAYINKINASPGVKYWTVNVHGLPGPIGIITLISRDYLEQPDIGFAFLPEFEGKGYAYEASQAVIDYVRTTHICPVLLATTLLDNHSSIRLLERLGFKYEHPVQLVDREKLLYSLPMNDDRFDH